jgi:hypothetical protein
MWTGINDVDKEANDGVFDDTDTEWQDLGNSRLGARVQVNDQIGGGFELGFDSTGVYERKIFGTYSFGSGKILVGQDYTPLSIFYSGRGSNGDEGLNGFGGTYDGRQEQIKLLRGGLTVALVKPKAVGSGVLDGQATVDYLNVVNVAYDDTDTVLPKIVVGYKFKTDMMEINPYVGYQSWDGVFQDAATANETEESIDSYVAGLGGMFNFGALYLNANVYYAQNPASFGLTQEAFGSAIYDSATATYEDNTSYGALLVAGFKLSEMFTIEAGYGMSSGSTDIPGTGGSVEQTATVYYVNFPITIAPGFFIVPEVAIEDYGDLEVTGEPDTDLGSNTWYGVRWQIDF